MVDYYEMIKHNRCADRRTHLDLAKQAHEDMVADYWRAEAAPHALWKNPQLNVPEEEYCKAPPFAMSVILYGNRLYASSSVRGHGIVYTPITAIHKRVAEALIECQITSRGNTKHRTWASCAEPMAAHIAFK